MTCNITIKRDSRVAVFHFGRGRRENPEGHNPDGKEEMESPRDSGHFLLVPEENNEESEGDNLNQDRKRPEQ